MTDKKSGDGVVPALPRLGMQSIGVVRTSRTVAEHTPVQAALNPDEPGWVDLDPSFVEGLEGLDGFDYVWLVTWLGPVDGRPPEPVALRQVPYLLRREPRLMGILATRGPRRINPIGLSLVRLLGVDGTSVRFAGVDLVDGTPVLDIKPYVARFDRPPGDVRCGWFDEVAVDVGATPASLDSKGRHPD